MLVLAIISTVFLSLLFLSIWITNEDETLVCLILSLAFIFAIITIWILYSKI